MLAIYLPLSHARAVKRARCLCLVARIPVGWNLSTPHAQGFAISSNLLLERAFFARLNQVRGRMDVWISVGAGAVAPNKALASQHSNPLLWVDAFWREG